MKFQNLTLQVFKFQAFVSKLGTWILEISGKFKTWNFEIWKYIPQIQICSQSIRISTFQLLNRQCPSFHPTTWNLKTGRLKTWHSEHPIHTSSYGSRISKFQFQNFKFQGFIVILETWTACNWKPEPPIHISYYGFKLQYFSFQVLKIEAFASKLRTCILENLTLETLKLENFRP